jgi:hypothetical protein
VPEFAVLAFKNETYYLGKKHLHLVFEVVLAEGDQNDVNLH